MATTPKRETNRIYRLAHDDGIWWGGIEECAQTDDKPPRHCEERSDAAILATKKIAASLRSSQ
ncbi:hypothetical protein FACS189441_3450 [Betaproteobacteria bacterium]|nr:hypothetical protein FACS189441_3450 [Betaproteobacteria bacterium]